MKPLGYLTLRHDENVFTRRDKGFKHKHSERGSRIRKMLTRKGRRINKVVL